MNRYLLLVVWMQALSAFALDTDFPRANWQDTDKNITFALPNLQEYGEYILEITNLHHMQLFSLRFSTATRGHNWEMEAGWTSRSLLPLPENMDEDGSGFIKRADIVNLTDKMMPDGRLYTPPWGRRRGAAGVRGPSPSLKDGA